MSPRLRVLAAAALVCALAGGCASPLLYSYAQKDYGQRAEAEAAQRRHFDSIRRANLKATEGPRFGAPLLFVVPSWDFVRQNVVLVSGHAPVSSDVMDYVVTANLREMRFDASLLRGSGLFDRVDSVEAAEGNGEEAHSAATGGYSLHCVTAFRGGATVWGYAVRGPNMVQSQFISSLDIRHAAVNGWDSLAALIRSGQ